MVSELNVWRVEAGRFADVRLMAELRQLARLDRMSDARILVLLAEVDERELFLGQGYSSLFRFAVCELRMSEAQAYLRIGAARVARRHPAVLEMLLAGALNLSTVKLLAPQLTAENHGTLLERARDKTSTTAANFSWWIAQGPVFTGSVGDEGMAAPLSRSTRALWKPGTSEAPRKIGSSSARREVELLIAEIAPKPDVQTRIRKMPARPARIGSAQAELVMSAAPDVQQTNDAAGIAPAAMAPHAAAATARAVAATAAPRAAAAFALESPQASCAVLSPGRYKLELTVDQALYDQLMTLKHLLKHRAPSGDLGAILGLAIKCFSERLCKQRFAELSKPASGARAQASSARASRDEAPPAAFSQRKGTIEHGAEKVKRRNRYVPRAVVRAVFARDGAQCTFMSADGKRCAERGMLELHHVKAFGHGGAPTPENLKVVCRSHNSFFAVQDFGAAHMQTMRARAR